MAINLPAGFPTGGAAEALPPKLSQGSLSASQIENYLANYGAVEFGPGIFTLNETIQMGGGVGLRGFGRKTGTEFRWLGSGPAIAFTSDDGIAEGSLSNIRIVGNTSARVAGSYGVELGRDGEVSPVSAQMSLRDVTCEGFDVGFRLSASVIGRYYRIVALRNNIGIATGADHRSIQNLFSGIQVEQNGIGVLWGKGGPAVWDHPIFQYNDGPAIVLGNDADGAIVRSHVFRGAYFESNYNVDDGADKGSVQIESTAPGGAVAQAIVFDNNGAWYSEPNCALHFDPHPNENLVIFGEHKGEALRIRDLFPFSTEGHSPMAAAAHAYNPTKGASGFHLVYTAVDNRTYPALYKGDTTIVNYSNPATTLIRGENAYVQEGMVKWLEIHNPNGVNTGTVTVQNGTGNKEFQLRHGVNVTPVNPMRIQFRAVAVSGGIGWLEVDRSWLGGYTQAQPNAPLYPTI